MLPATRKAPSITASEIFTMGLALVAGLALLHRYPAEALLSLAAWALTVFSSARH